MFIDITDIVILCISKHESKNGQTIVQQMIHKVNVFKNPNYKLLFWGVLVSNIAHVIFNFAISLYILKIANTAYGQNNAALVQAIYLAVAGILMVVLTPFGGAIADKVNKVRVMYITDYIRGIAIILGGIALFMIEDATTIIVLLFIVNIILSINSAFFTPSSNSLIRFLLKDEELQQGVSYLQGSHNLQAIIGLILGGILYSSLDIMWIFIINGVGYIISALSEMFIRYDHQAHAGGDTSVKAIMKDIIDGLRYISGQKGILAVIIMALSVNFFFSPIFSNGLPYFIAFGLKLEPSYLFQSFLTPEQWFSVISVMFSLSAIIMSVIIAQTKPKVSYAKTLKKLITIMVAITALSCLAYIFYYLDILPINGILLVLVISMFMMGMITIAFNIPVGMVIQTKVEKHQLGKINSLMSVLSQAMIPLASMVAGILISQVSIIAFYGFSIVGMILVNISYVLSKNANLI
jgi:MFS transporter, DHA3 family, macrolide efflux protein